MQVMLYSHRKTQCLIGNMKRLVIIEYIVKYTLTKGGEVFFCQSKLRLSTGLA